MARAALGWSIRKLAAEAKLASNTVLAFERGRTVLDSTVATLEVVLSRNNIEFAAGPGYLTVYIYDGVLDGRP